MPPMQYPYTRWEDITPERAMELLKTNKSNRTIRESLVQKYAAAMLAGHWVPETNQGLAIDTEGNMRDGQHRCWGVVVSGVTVRMPVTYNVSPRSQEVIDTGKSRTERDRAQLDPDFTETTRPSGKLLAAAKAFYELPDRSNTLLWDWPFAKEAIERARDGLVFATATLKSAARLNPAPVLALVARAYYHVRTGELQRFVEVFRSGVATTSCDTFVIRLRDGFIGPRKRGFGCSTLRRTAYLRTQSALSHWLNGSESSRLTIKAEDLFPILPEQALDVPQKKALGIKKRQRELLEEV